MYVLWSLQLLISAALLAKILATLEEEKLVRPDQFSPAVKMSECAKLDNANKRYHCSELEGGLVSIHVCCLQFLLILENDLLF